MKEKQTSTFNASGSARSYIRAVADRIPDPGGMLEFFTALDDVNATLLSLLLEETGSGSSSLREALSSEDLWLATEKLRGVLRKAL